MSIILDALKKLEGRRIPETTGEILSGDGQPAVPSSKRSLWLWSLAGILLVNTSILTGWLLLRENADQPAMEEPPAVTALLPVKILDEHVPAVEKSAPPEPPEVAHRPPPSGEKEESAVRETPVSEPAPPESPPLDSASGADASDERAGEGEEVQLTEPPPSVAAAAPAPPAHAIAEAPPPSGGEEPAAAETEDIPPVKEGPVVTEGTYLFDQLPAEIRESLKDLRIVVHVYSEDAGLRMLSVGEGLAREGDAVLGGVRLEEITPDGADFTYRGYRFSLSGH